MDKVTYYKCAIGTIEELKEGNVSKSDIDTGYLKSFFAKEAKKRIILPIAIGIYQSEGILIRKPDNPEDAEELMQTKFLSSISFDISRLVLRINDNIENQMSKSIISCHLNQE